jgi:alpha-tubulin suppressor-like RCC1 family protein
MGKRFRFGFAGAAGLILAASCSDSPAPQPLAQSSAAVTTAPTPTINNFVVYAANNVTLGTGDHSVGGNIGVATSNGTSPQLVVGAQDGLDATHTLYAPAISIGNLAQVGAVDTNTLTNSGGQVGAQSSYPSPMPPLPSIFSATPGTTNLTVAAGQQQTLTPGPYGTLIDNGIVFLNPGTYSFTSVTLGNNAQLQALQGGSTSILIAGSLSTGTQAQIFPAGLPASALTISVAATDGTNGTPPAVSVGASSHLTSLLVASNGTVSFGSNVQATGAFAGVNFLAGSNVTVNFQSGFANAFPTISTFVAYAELSMTLGSGDHTIGGDVGVAAVGAPSAGTQLAIGSQDQLDQTHTVYAPSVSLGSQAIAGDVDTKALTNNGGQFATQEPYPTGAMPLLPLPPTGPGGTLNITVASGQQQTLTPGPYGTLTDDGILFLKPGAYAFASVTLGNNAQLQALSGGSTSVQVLGTLATGTFAQIFPVGQAAGNLTISVAGNDGTNGSPPAASLGANTQITALFNAPSGTLSLGNNVQGIGAFAGFNLSAGTNVTLTFQTGFPPASQQPVGQQQLSGYITPAMAQAPLVGPLPSSTLLQLVIGLTLPNESGLVSFITELYTPSSPKYHKYLTPATFASTYGPTSAVVNALMTFLASNGLVVVNSFTSNQLFVVSGTAAEIEHAFFTNLNVYLRRDGTTFFAPDREPSLSVSAALLPILRVDGLDSFAEITPASGTTPAGGSGPLPTSSIQPSNFIQTNLPMYWGSDFRNAYFPNTTLTGSGQTIALVEFGGWYPSDITSYETMAGIPEVPVILHSVNGGTGVPDIANNQGEVTLDIEMAVSMAPGVLKAGVRTMSVIVYDAPDSDLSQYQTNADAIFAAIANPPSALPLSHQVSSSWGNFGGALILAAVEQFAAQGQSYFESSADNGAYNYALTEFTIGENIEQVPANPPQAPVSEIESQFITVVGGTQLRTGSNAAPYLSETTWNDYENQRGIPTSSNNGVPLAGGGGVVNSVPIPYYQVPFEDQIVAAGGSPSFRAAPDVSLIATDVALYLSNVVVDDAGVPEGPGPSEVYFCVGTSASAPLWAGIAALINEQATSIDGLGYLGFANPALYAIGANAPSDFHDIDDYSTNNTQATPGTAVAGEPDGGMLLNFTAIPGYDLATGWGTPNGVQLLYDLANSAPPVYRQVSVGENSACAITAEGGIKCWGNTAGGQIGGSSPAQVAGLTMGATAVAVSQLGDFACAVVDGAAWCWGDNTVGQLGDAPGPCVSSSNPVPTSSSPVAVSGLTSGVTDIATGGTFACAITAGQHVWCWGATNTGSYFPDEADQLGNGSTLDGGPECPDSSYAGTAVYGPVQVTTLAGPLTGASAVAAGIEFACAVVANGNVECWGANDYGQLGNGTTTDSVVPVQVTGLTGVTSLAAGSYAACAVAMGNVSCWGLTFGTSPVPITGLPTGGAQTVSAGIVGGCATAGGGAWCWGNEEADLADAGGTGGAIGPVVPGGSASPTAAVQVNGLSGVSAVSIGTDSACAISTSGVASCWGDNSFGELGIGSTGSGSTVPLPVVGFP